jgi:hypothetical protein
LLEVGGGLDGPQEQELRRQSRRSKRGDITRVVSISIG